MANYPSLKARTSTYDQGQVQAQSPNRPYSTSVFAEHRTIVQDSDFPWKSVVTHRLNELCALPIGWDGYAGQPVSFICANFAASMLARLSRDNVPPPSIVPGSDGTLQVEWHRKMFDIELDVLDAQTVVAARINIRADTEEVICVVNDFTEIAKWIDDLADTE